LLLFCGGFFCYFYVFRFFLFLCLYIYFVEMGGEPSSLLRLVKSPSHPHCPFLSPSLHFHPLLALPFLPPVAGHISPSARGTFLITPHCAFVPLRPLSAPSVYRPFFPAPCPSSVPPLFPPPSTSPYSVARLNCLSVPLIIIFTKEKTLPSLGYCVITINFKTYVINFHYKYAILELREISFVKNRWQQNLCSIRHKEHSSNLLGEFKYLLFKCIE